MNLGSNYAFKKATLGEQTSNVATTKGIGLKSTMMLGFVFITAIAVMLNIVRLIEVFGAGVLYVYIGAYILNFILQLIICFVPSTTKVLSIPYSISEGLIIGALVGILEFAIPGDGIALASLALIITVAIFLGACILYSTGVIKVGQKFRAFILAAGLGIVIGSLVVGIIGLFNPEFVNTVFGSNSTIGLIISVVCVILASLYVVASLDNANRIVEAGVDKKYEWSAAFGITINVVWLFLEVFRLLLILYNRKSNN
ncbi:MAG: Bax inhibitor-1/YccA family protein [Bacilli bacterium]|nr:Bax inhibitor-1/YccA family protein [Bacilli bacterium]MDD7315337.1 Bax inhibitor-1/YccA family protein [Bacilli bacterium]MDY4052821.1 Bax inhibitor-1/YccA family protein [Bacilli bacterium]